MRADGMALRSRMAAYSPAGPPPRHTIRFIGVSRDGNDPAGLSRCAQAARPHMYEFCAAAGDASVLVLQHADCHSKLPHSCVSEWRSTPVARSLVRRRSVAVEHSARDPVGRVPRVRTERSEEHTSELQSLTKLVC